MMLFKPQLETQLCQRADCTSFAHVAVCRDSLDEGVHDEQGREPGAWIFGVDEDGELPIPDEKLYCMAHFLEWIHDDFNAAYLPELPSE